MKFKKRKTKRVVRKNKLKDLRWKEEEKVMNEERKEMNEWMNEWKRLERITITKEGGISKNNCYVYNILFSFNNGSHQLCNLLSLKCVLSAPAQNY